MTLTTDTMTATTGWAAQPTPVAQNTSSEPGELERLRSERDAARAELARLQADYESFKVRVTTVGEAAARRNGWCGTYDAILDELGLNRPQRRIAGTITVTLSFTGTPNDIERGQSPDFVRDSLRLSYLETTEWLDSDWEDVNITIDADKITPPSTSSCAPCTNTASRFAIPPNNGSQHCMTTPRSQSSYSGIASRVGPRVAPSPNDSLPRSASPARSCPRHIATSASPQHISNRSPANPQNGSGNCCDATAFPSDTPPAYLHGCGDNARNCGYPVGTVRRLSTWRPLRICAEGPVDPTEMAGIRLPRPRGDGARQVADPKGGGANGTGPDECGSRRI
jgi:hypothetical protein